MNLTSPEDGDPLSESGQAQRRVLAPLSLAGPSSPQTAPAPGQGLGLACISLLHLVTGQAVRLAFNPFHDPRLGFGS